MKPLIHLFQTPNNFYFYDVNKNENIKINQNLYHYLYDIMENSHDNDADNQLVPLQERIQELKEQGYLSQNRVEEIKHPATDNLDQYLQRKVQLLTIQLTHGCNLRCTYCPYTSNDGTYRLHGSKKITLDTIKKALNLLRNNSVDSETVSVGFYGGEPLIEPSLIKDTVDYCKKIFLGKEVRYTITTNGTLISDEILELFQKENFQLLISLDGPKHLNDRNRKFAKGDKSVFDEVMKNINHISEHYPKLFSSIAVNMVIDPTQDFTSYLDLFEQYPIFNNINVRAAMVEDDYKTEKFTPTEAFRKEYNYVKFLSYLHYFAEINMDDKPFYKNMFFQSINKICEKMPKQGTLGTTNCPSGPCIPGHKRLMVSADGLLYPCERISEDIQYNCIGSVEHGFDIQQAKKVLNTAQTTIEKCKNCFAFRQCTLCVKGHESRFAGIDKTQEKCIDVRYNIHNELIGKQIISEIIGN